MWLKEVLKNELPVIGIQKINQQQQQIMISAMYYLSLHIGDYWTPMTLLNNNL